MLINSIEQIESGTVADKIIEIKSIYKNGKTTVQPVRDPLTGWYKGLKKLSDEEKKKLNYTVEPTNKFILRDGVILDLNKEEHRTIWEWVKYQPCLAGSYDECQTTNGAEFYVNLRNKEAAKRIETRLLKYKAIEYILNDNPANYPLRAKLFGYNMDNEKEPAIVKDFLLDQAEQLPEKIISIYEDKHLSIRMLVLAALEKHKIVIDQTGLYRYGRISLGMSETSAVDFLSRSENKDTIAMLEQEVNPEYFKDKMRKTKPNTPYVDISTADGSKEVIDLQR